MPKCYVYVSVLWSRPKNATVHMQNKKYVLYKTWLLAIDVCERDNRCMHAFVQEWTSLLFSFYTLSSRITNITYIWEENVCEWSWNERNILILCWYKVKKIGECAGKGGGFILWYCDATQAFPFAPLHFIARGNTSELSNYILLIAINLLFEKQIHWENIETFRFLSIYI